MSDLEIVMNDLKEMRKYFVGCAMNAAPGSEAEERYTRYVATIVYLSMMIREKLAEEDDGK